MQSNFTPTKPQNSSPVFVGSRVVGYVRGDTFRKTITGSQHILRTPPALAFDVSSLDDAERLGARLVEVTDRESGRVYRAKIDFIRSNGFAVNRGFGQQIALPLGWFSIDGAPPKSSPAKVQQQPADVQPRLF